MEHRILLIFYILYFIRVHFNIIKLICEPGSNSYRLGLYIAFTGQTSFLRVLIKPFFVQGSTHTMRKLTETGPSLKEKLILAGQQTQILPSVQRRRRRRRGWEPPLSLRKRRRIRKRKPLPKPLAKLFVILIFWFWLVIPLGPVPMIWISDHEGLALMSGILTQTL